MQKIAIFWDERFENNNFRNLEIGKVMNPFLELAKINGFENTISSDLLELREDRNEFLIISFLTLSPFNMIRYCKMLWQYRKNKKYFILYEPKVVALFNYSKILHVFFDKVYTWKDDLVDNKKYFKFIHHNTLIDTGILPNISFSQKKFLTLINGNRVAFWKTELYSQREKFIRFAEKTGSEFDLYGRWWDRPNTKQKIYGFVPYPSYRWSVNDKIGTLAKYKYNICFENMSDTPGYITEKIWDSFKAKSVPIYWGASNITDYVPKNCFIDYRDFWDFQILEKFLSNLTEREYNTYIQNIESFMQTQEAKKWFDHYWATDFLENLWK